MRCSFIWNSGARAFSGELDTATRRSQKDSGVGLQYGKLQQKESYVGVFQSAMNEVQSVHLPMDDQILLAELDNAWAAMVLTNPDLESVFLSKLAEKMLQVSSRPSPVSTPSPKHPLSPRFPLSPPRPLPTPPPAKNEKISVGLPPPTPPEDESEKRQLPRQEMQRRATSNSSNLSNEIKPSLSGQTTVDALALPMHITPTPQLVMSPKEREKKNRKRRSYASNETDGEKPRIRDREKEDYKGRERRKRDSMHEHLTSYTEQLESMLYGQWLNRLGARWPLTHVAVGGGK